MKIPDHIVHYNRSEPFKTITGTPVIEWPSVVNNMSEETSWGLSRFHDENYLERRYQSEMKMHEEFLKLGGKPLIKNPIYFFLGRNANFESNARNIGYQIALQDLPSDAISFTYGDSLLSYNGEYRSQSGEQYQHSLCAKIYSLNDLEKIIALLPAENALHLEVQLWMIPSHDMVIKITD